MKTKKLDSSGLLSKRSLRPIKVFTLSQAKKLIPKRSKKANKFDSGVALIVAGSQGIFGAAVLCAKAAARSGAGYVRVNVGSGGYPFQKTPDFVVIKKLSVKNLTPKEFNAVAIGSGMLANAQTQNKLNMLIKSNLNHVVVDAGALGALTNLKKVKISSQWILTPHEGEMSRLLGVKSVDIKKNREHFCKLAALKFGCHVILKGHHTIVAEPDGILTKVKTGNQSLAKAGTGDVLSGIICGFLAQGLVSADATKLGVFVHGLVADAWVKSGRDVLSLLPSDLIEWLPLVLNRIRRS